MPNNNGPDLIAAFQGAKFINGDHQCEYLSSLISKNAGEISGQLIGDVSHINHRAEVWNGIEVDQVDYNSNGEYTLSYSYEWYVYNGCADMDEQDTEHAHIGFIVDDKGYLEFDDLVLEERSTHEEF